VPGPGRYAGFFAPYLPGLTRTPWLYLSKLTRTIFPSPTVPLRVKFCRPVPLNPEKCTSHPGPVPPRVNFFRTRVGFSHTRVGSEVLLPGCSSVPHLVPTSQAQRLTSQTLVVSSFSPGAVLFVPLKPWWCPLSALVLSSSYLTLL
jgi:hypothetical protein